MPAKRYWLMKSEPSVYSYQDLERDKRTLWDGVRNYQARNLMRDDVCEGDEVLYYHSNADPAGVAGVARVVRGAYPDPTQFDARSKYHDPKSTREDPRWVVVDLEPVRGFEALVSLSELRANPRLADMGLLRRGNRLSVQPVSGVEFREVLRMEARKSPGSKKST